MVYTVFFSFSVQIFMINTLHSILKGMCILVKDISGVPGLVDRVLSLHTGSQGFDSHRGAHVRMIFPIQIDQDIRTQ